MAQPECLADRLARELETNPFRDRERTFRTAQQCRGIHRLARSLRQDGIDQIAADTPGDLGKRTCNMFGLALAEAAQISEQIAHGVRHVEPVRSLRAQFAEVRFAAVGQPGIDASDIVAHDAVAYRARAARVVARHAADRRPARSRYIDWEPLTRCLDLPVELIHHDAGLDDDFTGIKIGLDDAVQVLGEVDDQRAADRLAGLRRPAAARQNGHPFLPRNRQRGCNIIHPLGHDDADGLDLVE